MSSHSHSRGSQRPFVSYIRLWCACAFLAALSVILGKYLALNPTPSIRISFENFPILLAGILFGPLAGCMVGLVADLVGCLMVGYAIIPLVSLGSVTVGLTSGWVARLVFRRDPKRLSVGALRVFLPVLSGHVMGSMLVKSVALSIAYGTPLPSLMLRIPLYLGISLAEGCLILLLVRNRLFMGEYCKMLPSSSTKKGEKAHDDRR